MSVYVNNEKGNVVKVNFGDPNMEIKRDLILLEEKASELGINATLIPDQNGKPVIGHVKLGRK